MSYLTSAWIMCFFYSVTIVNGADSAINGFQHLLQFIKKSLRNPSEDLLQPQLIGLPIVPAMPLIPPFLPMFPRGMLKSNDDALSEVQDHSATRQLTSQSQGKSEEENWLLSKSREMNFIDDILKLPNLKTDATESFILEGDAEYVTSTVSEIETTRQKKAVAEGMTTRFLRDEYDSYGETRPRRRYHISIGFGPRIPTVTKLVH